MINQKDLSKNMSRDIDEMEIMTIFNLLKLSLKKKPLKLN